MFTAAEARKLAGPTPQEYVEEVLKTIKEKAKNKERRYCVHEDFWVNEAYGRTKDYKEATRILEGLGYKVSFYYDEGRQFVDMYTVIEW